MRVQVRELAQENWKPRLANRVVKRAASFFGAELAPPAPEVVATLNTNQEPSSKVTRQAHSW